MTRFYILLLAFIATESKGQIFSGLVTNKIGRPIDNATIIVNDNALHTHTDENGNFNLKLLKINDTLTIQHFLHETVIHLITDKDLTGNFKIQLVEKIFELDNVTVTSGRSVYNTISNIDIVKNPVNNAQELMRQVPGLIIGQHAGGGKAEQIFMRGFDIDHGTDINISVDGMPVNMVSHAHGQGYADLHFVIPETIENIDYGKGPYEMSKGNLTTAGYVAFKTKDAIQNNTVSVEVGQFNTLRNIALINLTSNTNSKTKAYVATEYSLTDGPFIASQAFNRFNLFSKISHNINDSEKISFLASHFSSRWDASGQIPQRAIDQGLLTRFGAIDDKEGGSTSRQNFAFTHQKYLNPHTLIKSNVFFTKYDFELFSNFTFFNRDSINGDQIKQKENRNIFGANFEYTNENEFTNFDLINKFAVGLRHDNVNDNELSYTKLRMTNIGQVNFGNVDETNAFATASSTLDFGNFSINGGFRLDHFRFIYRNLLTNSYQLTSGNNSIVSPKLNIQYSPNKSVQTYLKLGKGFHSNDTRVALNGQVNNSLPAAYGMDLGILIKPVKNLLINAAAWTLKLDQEFVYVGDEGVVEAGGKTLRQGLDLSLRYNPTKWLFIYTDVSLAKPRSIEETEGNNYIPLAPTYTNTGGINVTKGNFTTSLKYRHVGDRPANEDNSINAIGYTVVDFNISYKIKNINVGIDINNLLNTEWNETQFATESRLQNEPEAIEEIHFTPGAPFMARVKVGYSF